MRTNFIIATFAGMIYFVSNTNLKSQSKLLSRGATLKNIAVEAPIQSAPAQQDQGKVAVQAAQQDQGKAAQSAPAQQDQGKVAVQAAQQDAAQ